MMFPVSDRATAFIRETHDFVYDYLIPAEEAIEDSNWVPDEILREVARRGYFGLLYPQEWGGMGFNMLETCLILAEFHKGPTAIGNMVDQNNGIGGTPIFHDGSDWLKQRYLRRLATGEIMGCLALTEPDVGSDSQNIKTRAEKRGDTWVLNGTKWFITNAERSDIYIVAAVNDPEKRARGGITCFVVEKDWPGITRRRQGMMGNRGLDESEVVFTNVEVPESHVLGEVGQGFPILMRTLDAGRVKSCAIAIGYAERAYDLARDYVKERHIFGNPLVSYQAIQFMLADAATAIHMSRVVMSHAAARMDAGEKIPTESAMAKILVTESLQKVVDDMLQIYGARGNCKDWPLERIYRNYRQLRLVEGATELLKYVVARDVCGLKRKPVQV
jgi:acyl-CoA dehydrogenase